MKCKLIAALVILILVQSAIAQSPCNSEAEKKAETAVKVCTAKIKKSLKVWKDFDSAKTAIEAALAKKNAHSLLPYIGCDASDSSRFDVVCESDLPKIDIDALNKIIERSKGRQTLEKSKWITYGINKDIFLLCTNDYAFTAAKNYCDESGKAQPVIEVKKSKAGFYIFGVALSGA